MINTTIEKMQIQVKEILMDCGLESFRPSEEALAKMGISRRRFTILIENTYKTDVTLTELEGLKRWLSGFRDIKVEKLIGDSPDDQNLISKLGLTK